jgi:hypothetical protein
MQFRVLSVWFRFLYTGISQGMAIDMALPADGVPP